MEIVTDLQLELRERFPDTFAGFFQNRDGSFTALTVGHDAELRQFVGAFMAARTIGPARVPVVQFAPARHSRKGLLDVQTRVMNDLDALRAEGIHVNGTGLYEPDNVVVVFISPGQADRANELRSRYGDDIIDVRTQGPSHRHAPPRP